MDILQEGNIKCVEVGCPHVLKDKLSVKKTSLAEQTDLPELRIKKENL